MKTTCLYSGHTVRVEITVVFKGSKHFKNSNWKQRGAGYNIHTYTLLLLFYIILKPRDTRDIIQSYSYTNFIQFGQRYNMNKLYTIFKLIVITEHNLLLAIRKIVVAAGESNDCFIIYTYIIILLEDIWNTRGCKEKINKWE